MEHQAPAAAALTLEPLEAIFPWRPQWSAQRFWRRTDRSGECWLWTGAHNPGTGYGEVIVGGRTTGAHRVSYRLANGPIPEGYQIDHLCRVRRCVRPTHLEAVTKRENLLRGDTIVAANARKTHCPAGHLYDEANTWIEKNGTRHCRACWAPRNAARKEYQAARYRRLRDAEVEEDGWQIKLPARSI